MERRRFIGLFSGTAAWSLGARAQRTRKLRGSGYLGHATCALDGQRLAAFVTHLRDLRWIEGRTITIAYRWAERRNTGARSYWLCAKRRERRASSALSRFP